MFKNIHTQEVATLLPSIASDILLLRYSDGSDHQWSKDLFEKHWKQVK